MGNFIAVETRDFRFVYTEQPHLQRRREILKQHPEIRSLMHAGGDRKLAIVGVALCALQLCLGVVNLYPPLPLKFALNIFVGSWIANWLFLHMHEASHGLVFGPNHPALNNAYGIFLNLFMGVPAYCVFKRHHIRHHKYLGDTQLDLEYPSAFERKYFNSNFVLRLLWLQCYGLAVSLRSIFQQKSFKEPWTRLEVFNHLLVWSFNVLIWQSGMTYILGHFLMSFFACTGVSFVGTWGLSTHGLLFTDKEETVSYYGWLNRPFLNVGYHQEHHDFPNIPARLLPQVHNAAGDFYQDAHRLDSFATALIRFVHDPRSGIQARVKRRHLLEVSDVDECDKKES